MLLLFTILLIFILLSRIVETSTKIPSTLTLIVLSFILSLTFPDLLDISAQEFDEILYLMLPVILLPDILNISARQLKKHYKEILYLAVVAVIGSICIATFITPYIFPEYQFTIGMLVALFSMLMATDAITVANIMSKFKLPEKLKIYAESESLFNDVTALIIYYFVALPLISGGEITVLQINMTLLKVLVLSILIGALIAYVGYFTIKLLKNSFDQFLVIYLIVIVSFMTAEHFHIAGILSIVASVLVFKYLVKNEMNNHSINSVNELDKDDIEDSVLKLIHQVPALSKKDFREYKKESEYIGIFANAIVFIIVANIINFDLILKYYIEILFVFALTSIIRFSAISAMIYKMKLPNRWSLALTYSGAKGALAIIMVHSLPNDFIYKEMFDAIVVGNVLLSTFIYTLMLMNHIKRNENFYKIDQQESESLDSEHLAYNLVELIEKDHITGAYTQTFIEDIIEKELKRTQRYKTEFSVLLIDIQNDVAEIYSKVGSIIKGHIRTNDYFGIFKDGKLIILTTNTSLSGAMILAEKLEKVFEETKLIKENNNIIFGITQSGDTDTLETIMDKLNDALYKVKTNQTNGNIEIEA
ncbi:MAG: cation:proton antiporter [Campylobacterota bacterium]|nr:cation:proton antiporter [Campylobacterota bacterium]